MSESLMDVCCSGDREKTFQPEKISQMPQTRLDGILDEVLSLHSTLEPPDDVIAGIRAHNLSLEAHLNDLDSFVHQSRQALQNLAERLRNEMQNKTVVVPMPMDVVLPSVLPLAEGDSRDQDETAVVPQEDLTQSKQVNAPDAEVQVQVNKAASDSSDGSSPRGDRAVVSKLMEEHEDGIENRIGLDVLWQRGAWHFAKGFCKRLVDSPVFEGVLSVIIFVNAITIGIESDLSISGAEEDLVWASILEVVFLTIYVIELVVRLVAHQWKCFEDYWFLFDFVLVTVSLVGQIMTSFTTSTGFIQQVLVLRALRLLRVIRALRMIKQMRAVWRLVSGLLTSCDTMLSTLALLGLVLYIFAVLGIEMITKDESLENSSVTQTIVLENFSGLWVIMMTLSQFVTMDSIASIYVPLIKTKPLLSLYFTALVIIVSISLMNLVTAVLVEGALEHARQEKEEEVKLSNSKFKDMIPELHDLFTTLDTDNSGVLQRDEIEQAEKEGRTNIFPSDILVKANVGSITELFEKLDVDGSGTLDRKEFIHECMHIYLEEIPVRDLMMIKMIRLVKGGVTAIHDDIRDLKMTFAPKRQKTGDTLKQTLSN